MRGAGGRARRVRTTVVDDFEGPEWSTGDDDHVVPEPVVDRISG